MKSSRLRGEIKVRMIAPQVTEQTYQPNWVPVRQGSQDHEKVPSRRADGRYFRDGRVERLEQ